MVFPGPVTVRIAINHYTASCAAGIGLASLAESIANRRTGLSPNDFEACDLDTWIGRVVRLEEVRLPAALSQLHSRNNQLAWLGLQQDDFLEVLADLVPKIGADRIGVVIGTSTSSIGRTEEAYRALTPSGLMPEAYQQPGVHNMHSPSIFVAQATGITGPSLTISTACSSSAKVFATASRWIRNGLVDAVLVGGVDSLCLSVLYGFNSLELVSPEPCRPFDVQRNGISLGEAAGFAFLARETLVPDAEFLLRGYGESSDAYHMSHPHPEGKGAVLAMTQALGRAGMGAGEIDYINLHGTATKANDEIETRALAQSFPNSVPASSTKGWTGHALGAAGILEAVVALESMRHNLAPGTLNCENPDPAIEFPLLLQNRSMSLTNVMTNSFGFGGNNVSLIFGRSHD